MDEIGVRELRQNASRYLARVAQGETIVVTDRRRPIARLVPISTDPWIDLVSRGLVVLAEDVDDVAAEAPGDYGVSASAALQAMRADER